MKKEELKLQLCRIFSFPLRKRSGHQKTRCPGLIDVRESSLMLDNHILVFESHT